MTVWRWQASIALVWFVGLTGCGGGGGGGGGVAPIVEPPAVATYTVGGAVGGLLAGEHVTLDVNGVQVVVTSNGAFVGSTPIKDGSSYRVAVAEAPQERRCTVSNGSGVLAGAKVTGVAVDCSQGLNWVTDGTVYASALSADGKSLYLGGDFQRVGPPSGSFVAVHPVTGALRLRGGRVDANITAVIADGRGGHYVASMSRLVRAFEYGPIFRLQRVTAQGQVDATFSANITGLVNALALVGNTLYVSGGIGGIGIPTPRPLTALNASNGAVLPTQPNVEGGIAVLAVDGNTLYLGGAIKQMGGQARAGLGALDTATGRVLDWNPVIGSPNIAYPLVYTLAVSAGLVYVGGSFDSVAGQPRSGLAAVRVDTGVPTAWNPGQGFVGEVKSLSVAPSGNSIFVGGRFDRIGGASRNGAAEISTASGAVTSWDARLLPVAITVNALGVSGSAVYLAGSFRTVNGVERLGLTAVSRDTAIPLSFAAGNVDYGVDLLLVQADDIWLGGSFTLYGGLRRNKLAELDTLSGAATPWNPDVGQPPSSPGGTSNVFRMAVSDAAVVVTGNFGAVGGQIRDGLAAIDKASGQALPWNPALEGSFAQVHAMVVEGPTLYLGGRFTGVAGAPRSGLAAFDTRNWSLLPWAPAATDVQAMGIAAGRVYASHPLSMAAYDLSSGAKLAWSPDTRGNSQPRGASQVIATPAAVYLRGGFDSIGLDAKPGSTAAVDAITGNTLGWSSSRSLTGMSVANGVVFGIEASSNLAGTASSSLITLDAVSGALKASLITIDGAINTVSVSPSTFYLGGKFGVEGMPRQNVFFLPR